MNKLTIIYYTSNQEKPKFEEKIRANILKVCGNLPIISVSQKPINFGFNICVGEVGASNFNQFRQIQIACEAAVTPFVISTEADCLYPPDYFEFIPPDDSKCYRNTNIYILRYKRDFFNKKSSSVFSQIIGKKHYLDRLKKLFGDAPEWDENDKKWPNQDLFESWENFKTKNPCISIKTGRGMRITSSCSRRQKIYRLPYWGTVKNLKERNL
jgi:hypothetical protein